jgi:hypothetical protein
VAISETVTPSKERTQQGGVANKTPPASDSACFNDWKRFCAVLRTIASGEDSQPLSSLEAQKGAREVLTDCGYSWPGQVTANGGSK